MSIRQVDPRSIPLRWEPNRRDVGLQAARLTSEGQIEPIRLLSNGLADLDSWPYAEAQIAAAVELEWPTILVTP